MNLANRPLPFHRLSAAVLYGAIASSFAALPTAEAAPIDAPQTTVKFGDLDISQPQGASVLYRRIRAAADRVCSPYWAQSLAMWAKSGDCVRAAVAQAVATVDQPALSQIHTANTRAPLHFTSSR
jgi:UrcA family protein